jgi:hypothetical protein
MDLPERVQHDLETYARYFASAAGRKPRSMTDVILGILEEFLRTDDGFLAWKHEHPEIDVSDSPFTIRADSRITGSDAA